MANEITFEQIVNLAKQNPVATVGTTATPNIFASPQNFMGFINNSLNLFVESLKQINQITSNMKELKSHVKGDKQQAGGIMTNMQQALGLTPPSDNAKKMDLIIAQKEAEVKK